MSPDEGIEIEARFYFPRVSGDEPSKNWMT